MGEQACRICGAEPLATVQLYETAEEREFRWRSEGLRREQIAESLAIVSMIGELRREEGAAVTICCQNPDGDGRYNEKVEVASDWTKWMTISFTGRTLRLALEAAVHEKKTFHSRRKGHGGPCAHEESPQPCWPDDD